MDNRTSFPGEYSPSSEEDKHDDSLILETTASPHISVKKQGTSRSPSQRKKSKYSSRLCSVKKELIPLKVVLVCWFGAIASIMPYMTIYFKQLQITANEIAFIYSLYPIAKLFGPVLGGLISDKLGRYKPVLYTCLVFSIIFATGFLYIPPIPENNCQGNRQLFYTTNSTPENVIKFCCPESICAPYYNFTNVMNCSVECSKLNYNNAQTYHNSMISLESKKRCFEDNITSTGFNNSFTKLHELNLCLNNQSSVTYSSLILCFKRFEENCSIDCDVTDPGRRSTYECKEDWNKRFPTLALTTFIFVAFHVFVAICFSLIESTTLAMVKEHNDDYGRQRFWSILSTAIFAPLIGLLVDVSSRNKGYTDFSPAFYLFDCLIALNIILVYVLDLPVAPPAKQIMKNITKLLKSIDVIVFLIAVFFLGTFWGFLQSFLLWYLEDLGSPKYLLGFVITVGCLAGLPFLYSSKWILDKFGRINLLVIALIFYFIRCFGYSYIYNPWWFVLFEVIEIFTSHLMWVAAATYAASVAPTGLLATVQGCVAGVHFGIGRGSGTLIGGNLISVFGTRAAFRIMGVAAGVIGVAFVLVHWFLIKYKRKQSQDPVDNVQERLKTENAEAAENNQIVN